MEINSFSLHNQGGKIIWIVGNNTINEIHWPSSTKDYRTLTLQHYVVGDSLLTKWARPTLNYTGYRTPLKNQVTLSSRLIKQNNPLYIKYKLSPQTLLKLTIYDRAGKEVWSKEESNIEYGEISWSGKDQNHRFLQPGLYLLHYQFNQNNPQPVSLVILPP
jgi:hypothetical protein